MLLDHRKEAEIIPRLRNKVASSALHGLYREFDCAPACHRDDGYIAPLGMQAIHQAQAFFARRGVPGVIHVHDDEIVAAIRGRSQRSVRRCNRFDGVTRAFQQQTQRFPDIGLIVYHQDSLYIHHFTRLFPQPHRGS